MRESRLPNPRFERSEKKVPFSLRETNGPHAEREEYHPRRTPRTGLLLLAAALIVAAFFGLSLPVRGEQPAPAPPPVANKEWQLKDVYEWTDGLLKRLDEVDTYTATFVRRERIDGELGEYRYLFLKYRREPRGFYMYFLGPVEDRGTEVLYAKGVNNDRAHVARNYGCFGPMTWPIDLPIPYRSGSRVFFSAWNIRDITTGAVDHLRQHATDRGSKVRRFQQAKINGRLSTVFEVEHQDEKGRFVWRLFADDELGVPVRCEFYFAEPEEQNLQLFEEYTFLDVKFTELSDKDFDLNNPDYRFVTRRRVPAAPDAKAPSDGAGAEEAKSKEQTPSVSSSEKDSSQAVGGCRRPRRWRRH